MNLFSNYYIKSNILPILIDVGANRGLFTKEFNQKFGISKAILIEPLPEMALFLQKIFSKPHFLVYNAALSDIDKNEVSFFVNEFDETSSLLEFKQGTQELKDINTMSKAEIKVSTRTLDSIIQELNLEFIDLLKIDVQGSELDVLKGSKASLSKVNFIWVETSLTELYEGSAVFSDIHSYLKQAGFFLLNINEGYRNSTGELLQVDLLFKKM